MDIGAAIKDSWDVLKRWPVPVILGMLIINMVSAMAGNLLTGHAWGGFAFLAAKAFRGEEPQIGDVFKSFERFVDYLLVGLAMVIGAVFCGVGVFITLTLFIYAPVIIAETGADWKTALSQSKELVTSNLGDVIMLILAGVGLNLIGTLLCVVGAFITAPLWLLAVTRTYQQLVGTAAASA